MTPEELEKWRKKDKKMDNVLKGLKIVAFRVFPAAIVLGSTISWLGSGGGIHSEIGGSNNTYQESYNENEENTKEEDLALSLLGYDDATDYEEDYDESMSEEVDNMDTNEDSVVPSTSFEEEEGVILPLYNEETGDIEEKNPDEALDEYSQETKNSIRQMIENGDLEGMKEKGTQAFIKSVDFLFYNEPITKYGITRDMITEQAYQDWVTDWALVDSIVVQYAPDYKENLGEKYDKGRTYYDKAKTGLKNFIVERIGQEAYDAAGDTKDALVEQGKGKLSDVKKFVKSHYENFRSNHKK